MAEQSNNEPRKLVYQSINNVQAALAKIGIGKDSENTYDRYKFRGIDAVYNTLSPLLAEHHLCILPRVLSRQVTERENAKGTALFYVALDVEFDFVSALDGSTHTVKVFGEAMDRGDKATNKAMSAAYKYACFQAFAIPTQGDNDADASTHEVRAPKHAARPSFDEITEGLDKMDKEVLRDIAAHVASINAPAAVEYLEEQKLEADQKIAVWDLLDSKTRAAIKKAQADKDK